MTEFNLNLTFRSDFAAAELELFDVNKALLSLTPAEADLHAKAAILKLVSNCIEKRVGKETTAGRSKVVTGFSSQVCNISKQNLEKSLHAQLLFFIFIIFILLQKEKSSEFSKFLRGIFE